MKIDELYSKLGELGFIEKDYVAIKHYARQKNGEEEQEVSHRVLKIYSEQGKIAEVVLDYPYMMRTDYPDFARLNMLEQQALVSILSEFMQTPVTERQSEMYFAYYFDLNHLPHFIKKLPNGRLSDEVIPTAYLRTLSDEELQKFIFTMSEMMQFPADYRPRLDSESFVKVMSHEEMSEEINNHNKGK
ncbi:hypothetical protein [Aerococcus vaginalis]